MKNHKVLQQSLQIKGTIEIVDGQTTGTLIKSSNNTGDVYNDASELTATISSASGGNFRK